MVFNVTFNNISVLYIVVVSYIGGENHWPVASHWHTLSHNVVWSTHSLSKFRAHNFSGDIGTDCTGSCTSNRHTITTTTAPYLIKLPFLKSGCDNICCNEYKSVFSDKEINTVLGLVLYVFVIMLPTSMTVISR